MLWYTYAGALVPECFTFLVLLFESLYSGFSVGQMYLWFTGHIAMRFCRCTYCTVGARVMHLWCQGAAHFYWHYLYFEITNCDLKRVLLIIVSKDNANRRQNNKLV